MINLLYPFDGCVVLELTGADIARSLRVMNDKKIPINNLRMIDELTVRFEASQKNTKQIENIACRYNCFIFNNSLYDFTNNRILMFRMRQKLEIMSNRTSLTKSTVIILFIRLIKRILIIRQKDFSNQSY